MLRTFAVLLATMLAAGSAVAEGDNPFNGSWTITFDSTRIADLTGTVVIKGDTGTWDMLTQSRRNPCFGREYPITIQKASTDELVFTVNRAATLVGCKDSTYTFRKVDDNTLKGEVGEGRAALLTRK